MGSGVPLCVCVWGGGRERLVLLRVHQSPRVHFSLDSGSSYFRASLGQLGADQKPQAEETLALRVSAKGGGDTVLRLPSSDEDSAPGTPEGKVGDVSVRHPKGGPLLTPEL